MKLIAGGHSSFEIVVPRQGFKVTGLCPKSQFDLQLYNFDDEMFVPERARGLFLTAF